MVYDPIRDRIVLAGGQDAFGGRDDVWEFDGSTWQNVTPSPSQPVPGGIVWNEQRGRVVALETGIASPPVPTRLHEWGGSRWNLIATYGVPPFPTNSNSQPYALDGPQVYDASRDTYIIYIGYGGWYPNRTDIWEWSAGQWTQWVGGGPATRHLPSFVFDSVRQQTVLFGGYQAPQNETWMWSNSAWTRRLSLNTPPNRAEAAAAYDPHRAVSVIFGGQPFQPAGASLGDVWEWNGTGWTAPSMIGGSPRGREGAAMAYDSLRRRFIIFGGHDTSGYYGDTWVCQLVGNVQASMVSFGSGCPGPTGTPALTQATGGEPVIGRTMQMTLSNLPASPFNVPFGVLGLSNQTSNGMPLPASLAAIGAPGCTAWIDPASTAVLSNAGGIANWTLPLPFDFSLVGMDFYAQGAVLVPSFNQAGLVVSNAIQGRIGTP